MKNLFSTGKGNFVTLCRKTHAFLVSSAIKHAYVLMFGLGTLLLASGLAGLSNAQIVGDPTGVTGDLTSPGFNAAEIRGSVELLFQLIEGAFGALIMVLAGLGAIIAAAFGAYRAAVGMLVVAVGAFILRALVSLFFGDFEASDVDDALDQRGGDGA